MILLDANLLVYAHVNQFSQHERARVWLDERLNGSLPVGFAWSILIAFLRLLTNARIFKRPEPIARAGTSWGLGWTARWHGFRNRPRRIARCSARCL